MCSNLLAHTPNPVPWKTHMKNYSQQTHASLLPCPSFHRAGYNFIPTHPFVSLFPISNHYTMHYSPLGTIWADLWLNIFMINIIVYGFNVKFASHWKLYQNLNPYGEFTACLSGQNSYLFAVLVRSLAAVIWALVWSQGHGVCVATTSCAAATGAGTPHTSTTAHKGVWGRKLLDRLVLLSLSWGWMRLEIHCRERWTRFVVSGQIWAWLVSSAAAHSWATGVPFHSTVASC